MNTKKEIILLGSGVLNWPREERISDRYGLVFLSPTCGGYNDINENMACSYHAIGNHCDRDHGKLLAIVLETRESGHIGDFFHGITTETPAVGEEILLGEGTLFHDKCLGMTGIGVGLKPDDQRQSLWLNPKGLYRCHDQTVELRFEPTGGKP